MTEKVDMSQIPLERVDKRIESVSGKLRCLEKSQKATDCLIASIHEQQKLSKSLTAMLHKELDEIRQALSRPQANVAGFAPK